MTRVERDRVAAVVEVQAGPHRLVSLMTAEAVIELDLKVGDAVVCAVKSTNVVVEIPGPPREEERVKLDRRLTGLVVTVVTVRGRLFGCGHGDAHADPRTARPPPARRERRAAGGLTIYAASSLTAAFTEMKTAYQAANPGLTLTLSFGASSTLETQIEQGAPADVFASADTSEPAEAGRQGPGRAARSRSSPATCLTVIVPPANPAGVQTPADLAKTGLKYVAAGDTVPITKYADMLLANLATQAGYPAGFVAAVTANIVSKEDNVAAVVEQDRARRG